MLIREATLSDRDEILALDVIATREHQRRSLIDRVLRSNACLVAECDQRVVAYGAVEYTFFEQGFVPVLCVSEDHRRRGIGRALLEALTSRCRTQKVFTSTNQSNTPMQRLLESLGYVPSGLIHNLDPGDPELVYFFDRRIRAA